MPGGPRTREVSARPPSTKPAAGRRRWISSIVISSWSLRPGMVALRQTTSTACRLTAAASAGVGRSPPRNRVS
jgi:hypothetical protein